MESGGEADGGSNAEEELCLDIDWDDACGSDARKRTLVGRIVMDKALNKNMVRTMVGRAWNLQKGLSMIEVHENCFRFSFDKEEDCSRVLKGRPWLITGSLLVLERWQPLLTMEEIALNFSPYWIQLHDLPLEGYSVKNIGRIGGVFGEVLAIEDPMVEGRLLRNFARVRVKVDVNKQLIPDIFIPRPGKSKIWVKARYEKLQQFCYNCGNLGHDWKVCKKVMASNNNYGGWLGVEQARSIRNIVIIKEEDDVTEEDQGNGRAAHESRKGDEARGGKTVNAGPDSVGVGTHLVLGKGEDGCSSGSRRNFCAGQGSGDSSSKSLAADSGDISAVKCISRSDGLGPKENVLTKDLGSADGKADLGRLETGLSNVLTVSPSKVRFRRSFKHGKTCVVESGNSPYIVEMPPDDDRDSAQAIVVHGFGKAISELALGFQEVNLKRKVEGTGPKIRKKVRVEVEDSSKQIQGFVGMFEAGFGSGSDDPKAKGVKKRIMDMEAKLKSFKDGASNSEDAPVPLSCDKNGDINMNEYVFKAGGNAGNGGGGWPRTATRDL